MKMTNTQMKTLSDAFDMINDMRDAYEAGNFDKSFAEFLQACANAERMEEQGYPEDQVA
jgi:uncharacterized protein YutD